MVPVSSLRVGLSPNTAVETLVWTDPNAAGSGLAGEWGRGQFIPGVLDTGTSW